MEPFSKLRPPDAVRIKVRIVEKFDDTCSISSNMSTGTTATNVSSFSKSSFKNSKKFCVDPQITSYEILTNLIAQAFGIHQLVFYFIFFFLKLMKIN
jgi:hypothetical protein